MKDLIITSCFFSKPDLQRPKEVKKVGFDYISDLYLSVKNLNLNLLIFHDSFSDDDVKKLSTETITFKKVNLKTKFSLNDERFLIFKKYLRKNKYRRILLIDSSDVWFSKNPFEFINQFDGFSVGDETRQIGESSWMLESFEYFYGGIEKRLLTKTILNCGVIGGNYKRIVKYLDKFEDEVFKLDKSKLINDMILFNKIMYLDIKDKIYHGEPFNSKFKEFETDGRYFVHHK